MVKLNAPDRLFYWVTRRFSGYHAPTDPVTRTRMDAIGAVLETALGMFGYFLGRPPPLRCQRCYRISVRL